MRNLRRFRNRLKPIASAATLSLALPAALAAPVTWVGANGSFWDLATNWAPGLPGVADDALLGAFDTVFRSGTVTVNSFAGTGRLTVSGGTLRADAASSIGALTLSGGTLGGAGPVIVSGPSVWTSGAFADAGSTTFNGPLDISGGSFRNLSGRSLTFNGTTTWTNANSLNRGLIQTGFGASFNNNGSWLDQNAFDVAINTALGGALSSFNNAGTYAKSGDSITSMGIAFNNAPAGVVTVAAGTLSLNSGGTSSGTFNVASGATLAFGGGTHTLSNLTLGTGSGQLRVTGGTVNASGGNAFSGTLAVAGGVLSVTDLFSTSGFALSGGSAGGAGSVVVGGSSSWTGGAFADTGSTTFNGPVEISGGTFRSLGTRSLNFNGTTTWTNTNSLNRGLIQTGLGARINNNGSWLDQNAFDVAVNTALGGALSSFNNNGTYAKSGGSVTSMGIAFNNAPAAVVTVDAGTLSLNNGGASSGTFNVAEGATLAFGGGTHTLSNLNLGAGSGQLRVAGGTVNTSGTSAFSGTLAVTGGTLGVTDLFNTGGFALSGGSAGGAGSVLVSGSSIWTGGAFADTGSTTFNGPVEISGGTFRSLGTRSLNFNGTTTWTNVNSLNRGLIQTGLGARINNNGSWLDQNAFDIAVNTALGGALSSFNNAGTYAKSGDSITSMGIAFNNAPAGVVTVDAGTLSLNSGGASSGTFNVASSATLAFGGGTHTLSNLNLGTGSGQLRVNAGTVNASGTSAFSGTLAVAGGVLSVTDQFSTSGFALSGGSAGGAGSVLVGGSSIWTGGAFADTGSTTFNGPVEISGGTFRSLGARSLNFNGTTTWTNVNSLNRGLIQTGFGARINNNGAWLDQNAFDIVVNAALGGAQSIFNNTGSYLKTGSSVTDLSAIRYLNPGVTDVQGGVLRLPPTFVNEGLLTGDATVQATTLTNAGHLAPGAGPRTLSLTGAFVQTSAGHFDVELESPGLNDLFVVSGGATLGGTLELICFGNCTAAVGQSFTILDAADNNLTGTFSDVVLRGFGTGAFEVVYDRLHGDVLLNVTQAPAPVPEPGPLAMWSVGGLVGLWLRRRRNPPMATRLTGPGG